MRRHILLFILSFFCFTTLQAAGEKNPSRVAKITVVIHKLAPGSSINEDFVLQKLKTKVNENFSQSLFDRDIKGLTKEFDRVEPNVKYINKEALITLNLWPKASIRSITWSGIEHIKEKTLDKELGIKAGEIFNRQAFNTAFHKIKRLYTQKGYFEAKLDYRVIPDLVSNEVDIKISVDSGRAGRVKNITFEGFSKEEEATILDRIVTKEYNFLTSWFNNEGLLSNESLEHDKLTITTYLQSLGYADARVNIKVEDAKSKDRINLAIIANKGSLFTCNKIYFTGNTLFTNSQIESLFTIHPNEIYSPDSIRNTVAKIQDAYGTHGYIDASVSYEPHLVKGESKYNINFKIHEGKQYRVGLIKVIGNVLTQSNVILHESLLVPGELLNSRKLEKTEERLRNIGYFQNVNVYAMTVNEDSSLGPDFRDVMIEVEEQSTGSLNFYFGFSTLSSIFGGVEVSERNFNYKGLGKIFKDGPSAIRGGGEYARVRLNIGRKEQAYLVSWTKPYFLDTKWSLGFDIERSINRVQSDDYHIKALGFGLFAQYPINDFVRFAWHYRLRNSQVEVTSNATTQLNAAAKNSGLVSASGVAMIYDSTNRPVDPSKGFRSRLEAEYAGLGGDYDFMKLAYLNSYYYPIFENGTIKYRADMRFIKPVAHTTYDKLPLDERLYLGGETSVRGYRPYIIGPKFSNGDPKGGISSMLLSVEYLHKFLDRLDGFTFVDAGDVTDKAFKISDFRVSWGFGVRLRILGNVPVTLGMGFPVNAKDNSDVKRFYLSLGATF